MGERGEQPTKPNDSRPGEHTIARLTVDIEHPQLAGAQTMPGKLDAAWQSRLRSTLQAVLDLWQADATVPITIAHLEVDLGALTREDWQEEFLERLTGRLLLALGSPPDDSPTAWQAADATPRWEPDQNDVLAHLKSRLLLGIDPWWVAAEEPLTTETLVQRALRTQEVELHAWLRKVAEQPPLRQRLATQLSPATLARLGIPDESGVARPTGSQPSAADLVDATLGHAASKRNDAGRQRGSAADEQESEFNAARRPDPSHGPESTHRPPTTPNAEPDRSAVSAAVLDSSSPLRTVTPTEPSRTASTDSAPDAPLDSGPSPSSEGGYTSGDSSGPPSATARHGDAQTSSSSSFDTASRSGDLRASADSTRGGADEYCRNPTPSADSTRGGADEYRGLDADVYVLHHLLAWTLNDAQDELGEALQDARAGAEDARPLLQSWLFHIARRLMTRPAVFWQLQATLMDRKTLTGWKVAWTRVVPRLVDGVSYATGRTLLAASNAPNERLRAQALLKNSENSNSSEEGLPRSRLASLLQAALLQASPGEEISEEPAPPALRALPPVTEGPSPLAQDAPPQRSTRDGGTRTPGPGPHPPQDSSGHTVSLHPPRPQHRERERDHVNVPAQVEDSVPLEPAPPQSSFTYLQSLLESVAPDGARLHLELLNRVSHLPVANEGPGPRLAAYLAALRARLVDDDSTLTAVSDAMSALAHDSSLRRIWREVDAETLRPAAGRPQHTPTALAADHELAAEDSAAVSANERKAELPVAATAMPNAESQDVPTRTTRAPDAVTAAMSSRAVPPAPAEYNATVLGGEPKGEHSASKSASPVGHRHDARTQSSTTSGVRPIAAQADYTGAAPNLPERETARTSPLAGEANIPSRETADISSLASEADTDSREALLTTRQAVDPERFADPRAGHSAPDSGLGSLQRMAVRGWLVRALPVAEAAIEDALRQAGDCDAAYFERWLERLLGGLVEQLDARPGAQAALHRAVVADKHLPGLLRAWARTKARRRENLTASQPSLDANAHAVWELLMARLGLGPPLPYSPATATDVLVREALRAAPSTEFVRARLSTMPAPQLLSLPRHIQRSLLLACVPRAHRLAWRRHLSTWNRVLQRASNETDTSTQRWGSQLAGHLLVHLLRSPTAPPSPPHSIDEVRRLLYDSQRDEPSAPFDSPGVPKIALSENAPEELAEERTRWLAGSSKTPAEFTDADDDQHRARESDAAAASGEPAEGQENRRSRPVHYGEALQRSLEIEDARAPSRTSQEAQPVGSGTWQQQAATTLLLWGILAPPVDALTWRLGPLDENLEARVARTPWHEILAFCERTLPTSTLRRWATSARHTVDFDAFVHLLDDPTLDMLHSWMLGSVKPRPSDEAPGADLNMSSDLAAAYSDQATSLDATRTARSFKTTTGEAVQPSASQSPSESANSTTSSPRRGQLPDEPQASSPATTAARSKTAAPATDSDGKKPSPGSAVGPQTSQHKAASIGADTSTDHRRQGSSAPANPQSAATWQGTVVPETASPSRHPSVPFAPPVTPSEGMPGQPTDPTSRAYAMSEDATRARVQAWRTRWPKPQRKNLKARPSPETGHATATDDHVRPGPDAAPPSTAVPEHALSHTTTTAHADPATAALDAAFQQAARQGSPAELLARFGPLRTRTAGGVILHPYLPMFFTRLGLWKEDHFVDRPAQMRAALLLHWLSTGNETTAREVNMTLEKLLCAVPLAVPVPHDFQITPEEKALADGLLQAVIKHWTRIGDTSIQGLRGSFLCRQGLIYQGEESLEIRVEHRTWDLLLSDLPWTLSLFKLPWLPHPIRVEWA